MCICCIICNSSERFPFIMCSVRDEMYTRPTSDVKVHPVSGTTCCLDESLPEDKRGTWLAINHKLGTFSLLTNSSQQGRPEPPKTVVPSRGLLVLSAAETKNGRLSEPTLAVPVSWTNSSGLNPVEQKLAIERFDSIIKAEQEKEEKIKILTPPDVSKQSSPVIRTSGTPMLNRDEIVRDKSFPLRENIFASKEAIKPLSGFNLLSGSLLPGKLDVRFSSNLYNEEFDKCLHCDDDEQEKQEKTSSSTSTSTSKGWSMSNTFIDNPWEPRLKYLKEHVKETLKKYFSKEEEHKQQQQSKRKEVECLANLLGECMIAQPNFSDEALPVEQLNLSEKDKKNPFEVELERACQRNISSYCEWLDDGPSPVTETETNTKSGDEESSASSASSMSSRHASADHHQQQQKEEKKIMFETYQPAHGGKVIESPNEETEGDTDMMMERHNSRKIKSIGMVTPHCTFQTKKHHCRFDWGTRTHIIVITEKIFDEEKDERLKDINVVSQREEGEKNNSKKKTIDCLIHFFIRPIHARVDENGPRHGPAHQPNFELIPGDWKHLTLPHYVYNTE